MMSRYLQILVLVLAAARLDSVAVDVIIVVGAPGTPEYEKIFLESAQAWEEAAKTGGTLRPYVIGNEVDPPQSDLNTLEALLGLELLGESPKPLWIVLIGHGTFDGREAKFNLRGDDLNATKLAGWLEGSERPIAVINTSASSAPFIKKLSAKGRIVMTATKSGAEDSYARFGEYLAASINSPDADIDQDGATSLLEAFIAAAKQVAEFYQKEGRIATEQALVDDNGDGLGTPADWFRGTRAIKSAKDGSEPDGLRAHQWHLVPSEAERQLPAAARQRRDELEQQLFALRAKKDEMDEEKYFQDLEQIARALAEIYRSGGGPETPKE